MKRIFSALILLILVISVFIYSLFYIKDSCNEAKRLLEDCKTAYTQGERDGASAEKLRKYWSKKEKGLSVFVNHDKIDDIEEALHCLSVYSTTEEYEIFREYVATTEILLHQLLEDTLPGVHSIM